MRKQHGGVEWVALVATEYDLPDTFLRDGRYDYAFHTYEWKDDADVFADILARSSALGGDPSHIGVYNWNNGVLKREDIFPMMRRDMAFAIVIGADPVKDAGALRVVFSDAVMFPVIVIV